MVIGTTQATGKDREETALQADAPMAVGEVAEDQQGIDAGGDGRQFFNPDPPRGEPRAGPAQRAEEGERQLGGADLLDRRGLDMSRPAVATSTVSISSAATTMRAKPARLQGRHVRLANQALRRFADLVRARKCRRDSTRRRYAAAGAREALSLRTGFTCRNAFSNGRYLA